jgi:hypothetical protein
MSKKKQLSKELLFVDHESLFTEQQCSQPVGLSGLE